MTGEYQEAWRNADPEKEEMVIILSALPLVEREVSPVHQPGQQSCSPRIWTWSRACCSSEETREERECPEVKAGKMIGMAKIRIF